MIWIAAGCAALAVALALRPPLRVTTDPAASGLRSPPEAASEEDQGLLRRWRWWWALLAGLGAGTFVHGPASPVAGVVAGAAVLITAARAEPPGARRRREACRRELPSLLELYAVALQAGAAPGAALALVTAAFPGAAADALTSTHARLALGAAPATVWGDLAGHLELAPLGRTMARTSASGAPVAEAVRALADDLAARARAEAEDRARTVGVKAAVPLGLCLLPAFLLLGIVPLVAGALGSLTW